MSGHTYVLSSTNTIQVMALNVDESMTGNTNGITILKFLEMMLHYDDVMHTQMHYQILVDLRLLQRWERTYVWPLTIVLSTVWSKYYIEQDDGYTIDRTILTSNHKFLTADIEVLGKRSQLSIDYYLSIILTSNQKRMVNLLKTHLRAQEKWLRLTNIGIYIYIYLQSMGDFQ